RAIRGYIDVLADDLGEHLGPEGREYTRRIDEATRLMDALIQNLLAYSRLGKVELAHEPVNLADIVADAVTQLGPELDERHARLRIELEDGLPSVIGHRMTLVQAVTNLLHNAAKFVPHERAPEIR